MKTKNFAVSNSNGRHAGLLNHWGPRSQKGLLKFGVSGSTVRRGQFFSGKIIATNRHLPFPTADAIFGGLLVDVAAQIAECCCRILVNRPEVEARRVSHRFLQVITPGEIIWRVEKPNRVLNSGIETIVVEFFQNDRMVGHATVTLFGDVLAEPRKERFSVTPFVESIESTEENSSRKETARGGLFSRPGSLFAVSDYLAAAPAMLVVPDERFLTQDIDVSLYSRPILGGKFRWQAWTLKSSGRSIVVRGEITQDNRIVGDFSATQIKMGPKR